MSVLVRPWSALWFGSSEGRDTLIVSFSTATAMSCARMRVSSPFGPFTRTVWSSTETLTPLGMVIGNFPIRDVCSSSPDDGDQLAAGACLTSLAVGHHPLRRAEDGEPESVADARNLVDANVATQSRRRDALERADHRLTGARVLEPHAQELLPVIGVDHRIVLNEVVLLQEADDLGFHSRH